MIKNILYLTILLLFAGCTGGLAVEQKVTDHYYLVAVDADEQMVLCYHGEVDGVVDGYIINETVFAAGYNDKYIIAKQHPCPFGGQPDKTKTNYYILPLKKGMDWKTKNGLMGPLTQGQFEQKRKELGLEKVDFSIVYKDLE